MSLIKRSLDLSLSWQPQKKKSSNNHLTLFETGVMPDLVASTTEEQTASFDRGIKKLKGVSTKHGCTQWKTKSLRRKMRICLNYVRYILFPTHNSQNAEWRSWWKNNSIVITHITKWAHSSSRTREWPLCRLSFPWNPLGTTGWHKNCLEYIN